MISRNLLADILGVPKRSVDLKIKKGLIGEEDLQVNGKKYFSLERIRRVPGTEFLFLKDWDQFAKISPTRDYSIVELFAGCGGLALGFENAGFKSLLVNEIDKDACATLRLNRPNWNVVEGDVSKIDFRPLRGKVDVLTGGFPCQAFSYAGKKLGFEDTRGTLFYEFARAVNETQPTVFVGENVRGLVSHNKGMTLKTITEVIGELGYELVSSEVLKAIFYRTPQKRERLFLIGIRKDVSDYVEYSLPPRFPGVFTMRDALKSGRLFSNDVPHSQGQSYNGRKKEIMECVPEGGYWRDLPDDLQREYMQGSYFLGGGKTGIARRLAWDEPSLTLVCTPAQGQTERCHPSETRPLTCREYARIQTFPDDWSFCGSQNSIYKQIGNAVPVNLAHAVGLSLVKLLNDVERLGSASKKVSKRKKKGQLELEV
jgi:DNA (cytosine-5)-methyltransferase 1